MKTFEEWCNDNRVDTMLLSEDDIRGEMEDEYTEYQEREAGRIAKYGRGWLTKERNELRRRVDEVLRILSKDDTGLDAKHAWMYSEVGELEYAQHLDMLEMRDAMRMKNELFDAFEDAKQRQRG